MTREEVFALASRGDYTGTKAERLFCLLLDVADVYVLELEETVGAEDPAPGLMRTTPIDMTINGLRENLEMLREHG